MAKPGLVNIDTTQTFQNWFDKTNEMVDLFQTSVVTASALGDTTVGDALLAGDFTAANIIADTQVKTDSIAAYSPGATINFAGEINVNSPTEQIAATLTHAADGPQLRFTDSTTSWDIGFDNNNDNNFIINTGIGVTKFKLSPAGTLEVPNLNVTENFATTGDISANNVFVTNDIVTAYSVSDERLKENIIKIENPLEKMDEINGYTFNYKSNGELTTGVIAQEIEKVLPGVVFDVSDETGTFKAVRYGNIVGLLIEAIKELKAEVEDLKSGKLVDPSKRGH